MKKTCLLFFLIIQLSLTTDAQIFYVDSAAVGLNDGTSWVNAYTDLRTALNNVSSGEIWVVKGTYKPHPTIRNTSFQLNNNIKIYGGFIGNEVSRNQRDWQNNLTILSGEVGTTAFNDNSYSVLTTNYTDTSAIIDGFLITAGYTYATGGWLSYRHGAGIYMDHSSAQVLNCKIYNNISMLWGGGIFVSYGSPTISNCSFEDNDAIEQGGAIFNYYGNIKIDNCSFDNNIAFHPYTSVNFISGGGAIYNYYGSINVRNTAFINNSVEGYNTYPGVGGAILNNNAESIIDSCYFENNLAETRPLRDRHSSGGAIYSRDSNHKITNCEFKGNEALTGGAISMVLANASIEDCIFIENNGYLNAGGINSSSSDLNINRCIFHKNTAYYYVPWAIMLSSAGAIYTGNSTDTISNCSFRENTATEFGGAIYNNNCSTMLLNNTFTYNSANIDGGSLHNYNSTPIIKNCILWDNLPNEIKDSSSSCITNNSIIKGSYPGINVLNQDPYLLDIANNRLQLSCNSPAIDAGDNSIVISNLDLGGINRLVNSVVDIGAHEFSSTSPIFTLNTPKNICTGDSILIGGAFQYYTGLYHDTLTSIFGCDSLVITDLQVSSQTYNINRSDTICDGDSLYLGGNYQSIAGVYMDTIYSIFGCDSIIYSQLTINPTYLNNQHISICAGDSILLFGIYRKLADTYSDTLQSIRGCDSIQSITLTVNPTHDTNVLATVCQGDSILLGGSYQNNAGLYIDYLQTAIGCDSIVSTSLSILQPVFSTPINEFICDGDSLLIGNIYAKAEGTYRDTLVSHIGCDSIATYILDLHDLPLVELAYFTPDTLCLQNTPILLPIATPLGGTYSGNGVIGNQFSPSLAGVGSHYILYTATDANLCSNRDSSMITIDICLDIKKFNESSEINIYPNPSFENIYLQFTNCNISDYSLKVYNIMGELVFSLENMNTNLLKIENHKIGKGFYIVSVQDKKSGKIELNNKILLY